MITVTDTSTVTASSKASHRPSLNIACRLWRLIFLSAAVFLLAVSSRVHAATLPSGFTEPQTANTGIASLATMAVAPDGRIFVTQQAGQLRIVKNGMLLPTPFVSLSDVYSTGECGLVGVALHPSYASN